jgi:hypothetical protein
MAVVGIALAWQSHSKLRSIYTQAFFDRAPERISDHSPMKSVSALESPRQVASDGVVTRDVNESNQSEVPFIFDAKVELAVTFDAADLAPVDVAALESVGSESFNTVASDVDSVPTEADVDMVVAQIPEVIPTSKDIPAPEDISESVTTEATIDTTAEAPVETTMVSIKASLPDALDFSEIDLAEQRPSDEQVCDSNTCVPSRKFGTAIEWAENVEQAAELAKAQDKLVFLIQVSGNFAREGFT